MKNLTISTATGALLDTGRRLPAPRDYFAGVTSPPPVLPDHVLMFARRHSREFGRLPHAHHRFVLLTALAGHGQVVVDEVAHTLAPERALLVFPFQFHRYVFERPSALAWMFTTFELPAAAPLEALHGRTLKLTAQALTDLARACALLGRPNRRRSAAEVRLRISLVLTQLLSTIPAAAPAAVRAAEGSELLERVGRYVFAHLGEPISVAELGRGVGLSATHLRQELRTRYGLSPHGYVRQVKMLQAMRLLRTGATRIGDIADGLGYSSLFAFSRTFKLETGQSPRDYRRVHQP